VPPLVHDGVLLVQKADDGVAGGGVDLGRVGVRPGRPRLRGEFDHGALQTQADAEVRHLSFAGEADRLDLARRCRGSPKPPGTRIPSTPLSTFLRAFAFDFFGLDLPHQDPARQRDAGMVERLVHGLIGVVVLDVLADHGDGLPRATGFITRCMISRQSSISSAGRPQAQAVDDQFVELVLSRRLSGHLIKCCVPCRAPR